MEILEKRKLISFYHFSHEHPLERTKSPPNKNTICSACNLKIISGKDFYICKTCPFYLHQVCYNMPRNIKHPSHSTHSLTLLYSNSSKTKQCEACGYSIENGTFYYTCVQCDLYYHILCSALPLTISVSSHSHSLKLTFSPPYDFCCDICNIPSYNGWLYRCQICEFDTHISCAISNKKEQEQPIISNGQSKFSSVAYNESNQLAILGVLCHSKKNNVHFTEVVSENQVFGWDQRLHSPKKINLNSRIRQTGLDEFSQNETKFAIHSPLKLENQLVTQSSPKTPSSEGCFSIDLAKSYTNYDQIMINSVRGNSSIPKRLLGDSKQEFKELIIGNELGDYNSLNIVQEDKLKEAFLIKSGTLIWDELGQQEENGKVENIKAISIQNQSTTRSEKVSSFND